MCGNAPRPNVPQGWIVIAGSCLRSVPQIVRIVKAKRCVLTYMPRSFARWEDTGIEPVQTSCAPLPLHGIGCALHVVLRAAPEPASTLGLSCFADLSWLCAALRESA